MAKKITRFIRIGLFKPQADIIEKIGVDQGVQVSEVIRNMITEYGAKYFPPAPLYAQVWQTREQRRQKIEDEKHKYDSMSNEEYATKILKGKIREDTQEVEFRSTQGQPLTWWLKDIKKLNPEDPHPDNDIVRTHIELVNRTFTLNGKPFDEREYGIIFKDW